MSGQIKDITGTFNDILRGKAYIALDEATFSGDIGVANLLKWLVTTQQVPINRKFVSHVTIPVAINIWGASNKEVPIYVEEGDARNWIFDVSTHRQNDHGQNAVYYRELGHEIKHGGLKAFLHMMLTRDVSEFDPQRDIPRQNEAWSRALIGGLHRGHPYYWIEQCVDM